MMNEYHRRAIILLSLLSTANSFVPSSSHQIAQPLRVRFPSSSSEEEESPDNKKLRQNRRQACHRRPNKVSFASASTYTADKSSSCLNAIIYGWDGDDSSDDSEQELSTSAGFATPSYTGINSEIGPGDCPAEGLAVAESLSNDSGRMGRFARLAAAFSPPERGIGIQDIERVEVTCVRENQIELEAILCESYGCLTLSVPVQFPKECGGMDLNQGCVFQNLDVLDNRAETSLSQIQHATSELTMENADLDELVIMNDKMSYPTWWVAPELDASLIQECNSIQTLLNEAEFHSEIVALAQEGMEKNANLGKGWKSVSSDYKVQRAKVAAVGPSGICMKVAAIQQSEIGRGTQYLDVAYPFSASVTPIRDAGQLRANVLGVIVAAEASSSSGGSSIAP